MNFEGRKMRTSLPQNPRTQGERIRYARISANLTQERFANALAKQSKNKALDKAVVSKWESDVTTNPNNASMLAIQAVTGFSLQWLIHGTGEMRVATEATPDLHQESLERAILAVFPNAQTEEVRAVSALYSLVVDAPDVSDVSLARTAAAILKS